MPEGLAGNMVVAEEGMVDAGALNLRRVEWSVRLLALALGVEPPSFRAVEESQVHSGPVDAKVVEESVRVRRCLVSGAPQRQTIRQRNGLETALFKDVHVACP